MSHRPRFSCPRLNVLSLILCSMGFLGFIGCADDGPVGTGGSPSAASKPDLIRVWGSAGSGEGEFQNPAGVAISPRGDVYVADFENHRIQKFDDDGTFLTSWGEYGNAEGEFEYPRDVELDDNGHVYVAEFNNSRIQIFDSEGRFLDMWGERGTGDGQLFAPSGLAIDGQRVFVVDVAQRVQRFSLRGRFETGWSLYDGSVEEFPDVFGIDVDPEGNVWVVEHGAQRVRKFNPDGELIASWDRRGGTAGAFQGPIAITLDRRGRVLVADGEDKRIQMFDPRGEFLMQWTPDADCATPYGPGPIGIAVSPTGRIMVVDASNQRVLVFATPSRSVVRSWWTWGTFGTSEGTLYEPQGIAVDDQGLVYVSDHQHGVQIFTDEGAFIAQIGSNGDGPGQFRRPRGIATFADRIYVADASNRQVDAFDLSGLFLHSWPVEDDPAGQIAFPSGIATDEVGNVYLCATSARIDVFDSDGVLLRQWTVTGPRPFVSVTDVAVAGSNLVYVADNSNRRVARFDANGTFLGEIPIPPEAQGAPLGLDIGPQGQLFVTTPAGVLQYDAQGSLLTAWGSRGTCERQFEGTGDVAVDAQGRVFVTDPGNRRVQVFLHPYTQDGHDFGTGGGDRP